MEATIRAIQGGTAMKRHTPTLRGTQEIIADNSKIYYGMLKHPKKLNPVFTGKPFILGKESKKNETNTI